MKISELKVHFNHCDSFFSNDKWLRDPFGDQKGLLLMVRVTADDEGVYQCKVTVDGNEYTGNFRLDVYREYIISYDHKLRPKK